MADVTALLWSRSTPIFGAVLPVGRNDGGPKDSADHRQGDAGGVSGNQGYRVRSSPTTGTLKEENEPWQP